MVGGNYVKQDEILSSARDISLFPTPAATSCLAGGRGQRQPARHHFLNATNPFNPFGLILHGEEACSSFRAARSASRSASTLLGRCTASNDPLSCGAITRTASGAIAQIPGTLQNIAWIETDGIDAARRPRRARSVSSFRAPGSSTTPWRWRRRTA